MSESKMAELAEADGTAVEQEVECLAQRVVVGR